MMFRSVCFVLGCMMLNSGEGHRASSGKAKLDLTANRRLVEENDYIRIKTTKAILTTLLIRGGADKKVEVDIISSIQLKIVAFLKIIVPRSFWPKSWKSKSSKLMSKEHLEKSFAKGDSNSRVQKVLSQLA